MTSFAAVGLAPQLLTHSPIKGPAGNIEFLLGATREAAPLTSAAPDVAGTVRRAHEALDA
jgi:hypothetical protein